MNKLHWLSQDHIKKTAVLKEYQYTYEYYDASNFSGCCGSHFAKNEEDFYAGEKGITMMFGDVITGRDESKKEKHTKYFLVEKEGHPPISLAIRTKWKAK